MTLMKKAMRLALLGVQLVDVVQGTLNWNPATGEIQVTPAQDVFGTVQLKYTLKETGSGQTSEGIANIVFANTNDTATITDKAFAIDEDIATVFTKAALLSELGDVLTDVGWGEPVDC